MAKKEYEEMMKEESGTKGKSKNTKPVGTGNTRLKFDNKPKIGAMDDAKKANPKLEDLFDADALGSEIETTPDYSAKSKKGFFDKSVFEHKSNEMNPTEDY